MSAGTVGSSATTSSSSTSPAFSMGAGSGMDSETPEYPGIIAVMVSKNSVIDWGRSPGSLAMQRRISCSSSLGMSLLRSDGLGGSAVRCWVTSSI